MYVKEKDTKIPRGMILWGSITDANQRETPKLSDLNGYITKSKDLWSLSFFLYEKFQGDNFWEIIYENLKSRFLKVIIHHEKIMDLFFSVSWAIFSNITGFEF